MNTSLPKTFTEVPGWREEFTEAAERLDSVRIESLYDFPHVVLGRKVRSLTLADWTIFDAAKNPFFVGGVRTVAHAANILWVLSPRFRENSSRARFWRRYNAFRIYAASGFDDLAVIEAVDRFIDDAFLDSPGRFADAKGGKGVNVVQWPRKAMEIEFCAEIMGQFPSIRFADLRRMPLAQFWQWLHAARAKALPEYRNYQLTDAVNTQAVLTLNRLRAEANASKK